MRPLLLSGTRLSEADLLLDVATNSAPAVQFERSIKFSTQGIAWDRFLLGMAGDAFDLAATHHLATRLGMPDDLQEALDTAYQPPSTVLLGFERAGSRYTYKLYLEFWGQLVSQVRRSGAQSAPLLLNIGFKWDLQDPGGTATTAYTCYPMLTVPRILERIGPLIPEREFLLTETARELVLAAARNAEVADFVYMEAVEAGVRHSFDLNLYKGNLIMMDVGYRLTRLAHQLCPDQSVHLLEHVGGCPLGHVSAGMDRAGDPFLTVYFEDELPKPGP
ncbi:MAG TPA: hypothetical protein VJ998_09910 [Pseudomonadales bacterium]|nr:hypothetical protein [Pseudomonadales bacterium]